MSLSRTLTKASKTTRTVSAVASGNPRRIARRSKNVAVGRAAAKAGVWRRLWG